MRFLVLLLMVAGLNASYGAKDKKDVASAFFDTAAVNEAKVFETAKSIVAKEFKIEQKFLQPSKIVYTVWLDKKACKANNYPMIEVIFFDNRTTTKERLVTYELKFSALDFPKVIDKEKDSTFPLRNLSKNPEDKRLSNGNGKDIAFLNLDKIMKAGKEFYTYLRKRDNEKVSYTDLWPLYIKYHIHADGKTNNWKKNRYIEIDYLDLGFADIKKEDAKTSWLSGKSYLMEINVETLEGNMQNTLSSDIKIPKEKVEFYQKKIKEKKK